MQNKKIIKNIENIKVRKNYEKKKATKLGLNHLYDYIEEKILKQKKAI